MSAILIGNRDHAQIFVWDNRYQKIEYTNATGSPVTISLGRLIGRITSSQKALPHVAAATDGSQQPIGVAADTYVVAPGVTVMLTICDGGDVAEELLLFNASETLSTVITDDVSIRSALVRNTNIKPVKASDLTGPYDNQ